MTEKVFCKCVFFVFCFLIISDISICQKVEADTSKIFKEEIEYKNFNPDSANPNFIPPDILFLPSDLLYNNKWDTLNIGNSKGLNLNKSDTVRIVLKCDSCNKFVFPYKGKLISDFGFRGRRPHTGTDIKLNLNDSVLCAFDGVVRMSRYYHGYGNMVVVRHNNGLETLYGHLNKRAVKANQIVKAGDLIGYGGRTGRATCNHLHFETRYLEVPFNPHTFIDFNKYGLTSDTVVIVNKSYKYNNNSRIKGNISYVSNIKNDKNNSGTKYYTIKKEDTLSKIAKKYGTSVKKICTLNNITPTTILKLGRKIKVN